MKEFKRYLVTAALPYANGPLHIGHLSGCYLPADIYVRYLRAGKKDVVFISGTDEHGVPITIKAIKEGTTPKDIVDKFHAIIRDSFDAMGISFDIFSRTSNLLHHKTASDFFKNLYDHGLFEEKESEQYFDPQVNLFLADRYIRGICPVCGYENAYGDQCEQCGSSLSPEELINPRSVLSDAIPVKRKTRHWYMPLQDYEPWLKEWILEGHREWKNNVYGQCKSWLDHGLQSRAMTRDSSWGVPVPIPGAEGKVLYVWFDAPIGYISATRELLPEHWEDYWKSDDTRLIHFIGKDNIVFHCIIFPAMLRAHGGFILPDNVPANEFLNIEGQKVSTSRNWAVWIHEYLKDFPDSQDVLRYVLCATSPETKDNDFTWKDFQDRNNNELVAILGNFVNRTMILMHKLCQGKVPPFHSQKADSRDEAVLMFLEQASIRIGNDISEFRFRDGLADMIQVAREGNKYMQDKAPWLLSKSQESQAINQDSIDNCLHICLQITANLAILMNPFLPFTARKVCHMLKVVDRMLEWENAGSRNLVKVGYSLRAPELLFRKVEDIQVQEQLAKLRRGPQEVPEAHNKLPSVQDTVKPEIPFSDFEKIDLKVGTIRSAERIPKSEKLLRLKIDIGTEVRTVVSGIAQHYTTGDLEGKQVILVANLAPRNLKGIESRGMVLMTEDSTGKLLFLIPEFKSEPGTRVS